MATSVRSSHRTWPATAVASVLLLYFGSRAQESAILHGINRLSPTCGVITTILEVNEAVAHIVKDTSISLVVVGDLKTNHMEWKNFQATNEKAVVYLSPQDQRSLPFQIVRHIPWNHFGRKSIGFMYAIAGGCEKVYDFDDDNHLTIVEGLGSLKSWEHVIAKRVHPNGIHCFNPYPYFHPSDKTFVWPRGFPLQFIQDVRTYNFSSVTIEAFPAHVQSTSIAVLQSLADHDPDVDAIYRLTKPLPIFFHRKKTVLLPERGLYVPWNAQAVLISYPAFFGTLLPVTVTGRVSDIWRSYITTRLLWETSHSVAFASSFVTQYRNPHNYMTDFRDEDDLYKKADELLATLSTWTSKRMSSLDEAYLDLMRTLVKGSHILGNKDLVLAEAWVRDLKSVGYVWPKISRRMHVTHHTNAPVVDQRNFFQKY